MKKLVVFIAFALVSLATSANFSVSTQRLYFDASNRSTFLVINNKSPFPLKISTRVVHYDFLENGNAVAKQYEDVKDRSARELVRYSPRTTLIPPLGQQMLRFKMRKKPGLEEGEYRSYLKIIGHEVQQSQPGQGIGLSGQLAHNLPIIVRNGQTHVQSVLSEAKLVITNQSSSIQLKHTRNGNRSIYGDYQILDSDGNEVGKLLDVGIFPPATYRQITIPISKSTDSAEFIVRFVEDPLYGGDLSLETLVQQ